MDGIGMDGIGLDGIGMVIISHRKSKSTFGANNTTKTELRFLLVLFGNVGIVLISSIVKVLMSKISSNPFYTYLCLWTWELETLE